MKRNVVFILGMIFLLNGCAFNAKEKTEDWCGQPLRTQFSTLMEVHVTSDWFKVYEVGKGVYAIAEPFNFQEVISYLIIGNEKALLFDSGMGMASI